MEVKHEQHCSEGNKMAALSAAGGCVYLMIMSAVVADQSQIIAKGVYTGYHFRVSRERRSLSAFIKIGALIAKGIKARNALLHGTARIMNFPNTDMFGARTFRFTKHGGWKEARADFYSVKPYNVERSSMGQEHFGHVGDRSIKLVQKGPFDRPTITIFTVKTGGGKPVVETDEIIYIIRAKKQ